MQRGQREKGDSSACQGHATLLLCALVSLSVHRRGSSHEWKDLQLGQGDLGGRQRFPLSNGADKAPQTHGDLNGPTPSLMGATRCPILDREVPQISSPLREAGRAHSDV